MVQNVATTGTSGLSGAQIESSQAKPRDGRGAVAVWGRSWSFSAKVYSVDTPLYLIQVKG